MKNNLIILSGGMDSTTLLYKEKDSITQAISFYYGQKHVIELKYAKYHCELLNISHKIINIDNVFQLMTSSLLSHPDSEPIPEGHYEDKTMESTVVPFRNGIMLAIAVGIAESNDCETVFIANHSGDHAIYPDCRSDFIVPFRLAVRAGTYNHVEIAAPFRNYTKKEIAQMGYRLNIDYTHTWSCYKGLSIHCGKCSTCVERKESLGDSDPTKYMEAM